MCSLSQGLLNDHEILMVELFDRANQIAVFLATQTRRVLVPRFDDRFEEPVIDVAILKGFQKLGYDRPTRPLNLQLKSAVRCGCGQ